MNKTISYKKFFIVFMFITGMLVGCTSKENQAGNKKGQKIPLVEVLKAEKKKIVKSLSLTGEVFAIQSVVVYSTVEGNIGYCPWREGDVVEKAGVKLIEVVRETYKAEVKATQTSLDVQKAKLEDIKAGIRPEEIFKAKEAVHQLESSAEFAKNDLARISKLFEGKSLPFEAVEKARVEYTAQQTRLAAAKSHLAMLEAGHTKTAIAVQEAIVKESQAKVDLAQARWDECTLFAPFAGIITKAYVRSGDMIYAKVPLLELVDFTSLIVRVAVPEAYSSEVEKDIQAMVTLDAFPGKSFTGKIVRIYPELDKKMRTRNVEIILTDASNIIPGMFARVNLILKSVPDAIVVPQDAILVSLDGKKRIFVLEEEKVVQRAIMTGIQNSEEIQVISGLKEGETFVVRGNEKLKNNAQVQIKKESSPAKDKVLQKGSQQ